MRCDEYRDAASAALDGEPTGRPAAALDAHRRDCEACTTWQRDVEDLTRRARVRQADGPPAGFTAAVLTGVTLATVRTGRRVIVLRWLLAAVGVLQVALALPAVFHDDLGMAMSVHASHESAAWSLAVAVALLLVAARPAQVGGALTAVGTFVVVLTGLSVADVVRGGVGVERLSTHAAAAAGAVLLLALQRTTRHLPAGVPVDPAVADPADADALADWSRRLHEPRRDVA